MASGPGTQHFTLARQIAELVWRQHFRIPEPVYWIALILVAIGFSTESPLEAFGWTVLIILSVVGIARWHWHRRPSRALVITRFSTVRGTSQWRRGCRSSS